MSDSQTFDLRPFDVLSDEQTQDILRAQRLGPVDVLVEPGSQTLKKLLLRWHGQLREVREGVWRLGA